MGRLENITMNVSEENDQKAELKSTPSRIILELTNRCDLRCVMCGRNSMEFSPYIMPLEIISQVREQLAYNAQEVTLFGWGEPFLYPRLKEALDIVTEYGHDASLITYISTNGLTLSLMKEILRQYPVTYVTVSVDGATKEIYNAIRKGSDFDIVCQNIRALRKFIGGSRVHTRPYIRLSFVIMKRNVHQLPAMVQLANDLDVPEVRGCFLTVFDKRYEDESLFDSLSWHQNLYQDYSYKAKIIAYKLGVKLQLPIIEPGLKAPHRKCSFPFSTMFIGADGNIRPCQASPQILRHVSENLKEDWNCQQYQQMRAIVNNPKDMPQPCQYCYQTNVANFNLRHAHIYVCPEH